MAKDELIGLDEYRYGFHDPDVSVFRSGKGLSREGAATSPASTSTTSRTT
jgi:hypothetical protein